MIPEQQFAIEAARHFKEVVNQIRDDQWDTTLPPSFKNFGEPMTVRETINYHAYDDAWIPDMLAGRTMQEVGEDKWKGDLLGDDPAGSYAHYNDTACVAIEKLDDPERMAHLSFGDYKARDFLLQVISFRGLRAYDFAKHLGFDTTLPPDLVQAMWDLLTPHAGEWRQYNVYDPALPVSEDAPPQEQLLRTLGYE